MRWHEPTKQFVYQGRILSSPSDVMELKIRKSLTRYAMPVPGGRIVSFERKENSHNIDGYHALYKINVRLKDASF